MKLYSVDFDPMWPVPSCLIILADSRTDAMEIAEETVKHTKVKAVQELPMERGVVVYESGDY